MTRRQILSFLSASSAFVLLGLAFAVQALDTGEPATVRLLIDYGSGVEKHFNRIEWVEGMTVLVAMEQARDLPAPLGLAYDQRGRGEMAFIRSIDGLENEGGGKEDRNWIFRVDGEVAQQGCGATVLESDDVVRWTFGAYNMDENEQE